MEAQAQVIPYASNGIMALSHVWSEQKIFCEGPL